MLLPEKHLIHIISMTNPYLFIIIFFLLFWSILGENMKKGGKVCKTSQLLKTL